MMLRNVVIKCLRGGETGLPICTIMIKHNIPVVMEPQVCIENASPLTDLTKDRAYAIVKLYSEADVAFQ